MRRVHSRKPDLAGGPLVSQSEILCASEENGNCDVPEVRILLPNKQMRPDDPGLSASHL